MGLYFVKLYDMYVNSIIPSRTPAMLYLVAAGSVCQSLQQIISTHMSYEHSNDAATTATIYMDALGTTVDDTADEWGDEQRASASSASRVATSSPHRRRRDCGQVSHSGNHCWTAFASRHDVALRLGSLGK